MPLQWRNQIWQSLEEGAGKRCSECGVSLHPLGTWRWGGVREGRFGEGRGRVREGFGEEGCGG